MTHSRTAPTAWVRPACHRATLPPVTAYAPNLLVEQARRHAERRATR